MPQKLLKWYYGDLTGYKLWIIDVLLKSCGWLINVLVLFVRSLLYCDRYCKSSVGLHQVIKKTYIAIYHDVTILGDQAVWPGVVPSDVPRSDLVKKHIKRSIAIFVGVFSIKIKI